MASPCSGSTAVACMLDPRMLRGLSFAAWQVLFSTTASSARWLSCWLRSRGD